MPRKKLALGPAQVSRKTALVSPAQARRGANRSRLRLVGVVQHHGLVTAPFAPPHFAVRQYLTDFTPSPREMLVQFMLQLRNNWLHH